jgi:hypothetical protein
VAKVAVLELEDAHRERWHRTAERAALVRAHESVRRKVKSFGRKRIDMGGLVLILLKLSITVLDENHC